VFQSHETFHVEDATRNQHLTNSGSNGSMLQRFIVSYDSANNQKHYKKPLHQTKPIISEHQSKWKCNGAIADQRKQRGVLCHVGLVKDHGGHLVNQPCLLVLEKCWKTTLGNEITTVRKTNKYRTWWRKCTGEQTKMHAYIQR